MNTSHPPRLIAFCGAKGSGKSECAKALELIETDRHDGSFMYADPIPGYRFHRISFADPLREMLEALGIPRRNLSEPDLKEVPLHKFGGKSARQLMQSLGTEWGRDLVDSNLWIDLGRERIKSAMRSNFSVVIDDLRFDNEAVIIRELGGMVVQIIRPDVAQTSPHRSEAGILPHLIDTTRVNGSDLQALQRSIRRFVAAGVPVC